MAHDEHGRGRSAIPLRALGTPMESLHSVPTKPLRITGGRETAWQIGIGSVCDLFSVASALLL